MNGADTMTVEERLDRVVAIMVAMENIAIRGDMIPGRGTVCATLGTMADDEMMKVRSALGADVMNKDC